MNQDLLVWIIGAICGAGAVLAGGAFWFGRHVSTVDASFSILTKELSTLVETVKDIGEELKNRDETLWRELEKRDGKIEALGKRHDELKERVVIVEHEIKK